MEIPTDVVLALIARVEQAEAARDATAVHIERYEGGRCTGLPLCGTGIGRIGVARESTCVACLRADNQQAEAELAILKAELREISLALNDPAEHNIATTAQCVALLRAELAALKAERTCATCRFWDGSDHADYRPVTGRCSNPSAPGFGSVCGFWPKSTFGCILHEPTPPTGASL